MGLSASFKTVWSREMQEVLWVSNIWRPTANFRLESELEDGDRVKRIRLNKGVPQDYTRYQDLTFAQKTTSAEELVVDKTPTNPFVISDLDELQSTPKARSDATNYAVEQLNNIINGYYTAQVVNAGATVDAASFGGTAGQGALVTPANVKKLFTIAQRRLGRQNVVSYKTGESPLFANITPEIYQALIEMLGDKETPLGDTMGENGHAGRYMGFDLYVTNGGYVTLDLGLATNPTDADTISFQIADRTITVTFKSTVDAGVTAGQVKIASTVDLTRANLVAFLNAPGTTVADSTNAGYNALAEEDQALLYGSVWTNNNSTDKATATWRGAGSPILGETLTAAADVWTVGLNISHCLFGKKGSIDAVLQRNPKIQIDRAENRIEEWKIKPYTLFGFKTFADGARKLVNVKVDITSIT
jgi:hypothetical protein